ncbi:MAG: hypothetical protein HC804_06150, partial [Anaerolineae bacterium]|nr:hypothetical protein [Anaerolineae bacterium]
MWFPAADLFSRHERSYNLLYPAVSLALSVQKYHKANPEIKYRQYNIINEDVPFVTVQLPMYNEMYVAERIIDYVAAQEYPKDKFEIQVLDDSTDETVSIVAAKVAALRAQGF